MSQVDPISKHNLTDYDYKDIEYMAKVNLHVHVHVVIVHACFVHVTVSTIPKIVLSLCVCT